MKKDYFLSKKDFLNQKGINVSHKFRDNFNIAINKKSFCERIKKMEEADFDDFKKKVGNLFDRLDSIGFMLHIMRQEENDWEKFMKHIYDPNNPPWPPITKIYGILIAGEKPTSLCYAFEAFLFFVGSYLEYLTDIIGLIFKNKNISKFEKLIKVIRQIKKQDKFTKAILKQINEYNYVWLEIQKEGVRKYFDNIEPSVKHYKNKTLRSVGIHKRPLKMSGIQMSIAPEGEIKEEKLKAGSYKRGNKAPFGNMSAGIIPTVENYFNDLIKFQTSISEIIYGKRSLKY